MRTIIFTLTLSFLTTAGAGVTGSTDLEYVVCEGDGARLIATYWRGTGPTSAAEVINNPYKTVRVFDASIMAELTAAGLIKTTDWDKTGFFASIGQDIKLISEHVNFVVSKHTVDYIGGGATEYTKALPLALLPMGELPKTWVDKATKQVQQIKAIPVAANQLELRFAVIELGVQKCVKSVMELNPYKIPGDLEDTSPDFIERCVQTETLSQPREIQVLSKTFDIEPTCKAVDSLRP